MTSSADMINGRDINHLPRELQARVLERLGLDSDIPLELDGLKRVYAAWCEHVPFDNIRKMISLRSEDTGPLGGLDAVDFFDNWLANGSGGTCWPSSNALYSLLISLGFSARRSAGSMYDMGLVNHGTVIVTINGQDWMADTSILSYSPIPVGSDIYIHDDPRCRVEVEPLEDLHMLWIDFVPVPVHVPCRLMEHTVDSDFYNERYEVFSREMSPFNNRLYFRKGGPDGVAVVLGNTRFARTANGLDVREFSRDELRTYLREQGVSESILTRWIESGSLELSFDPSTANWPLQINGTAPSLRTPRPAFENRGEELPAPSTTL